MTLRVKKNQLIKPQFELIDKNASSRKLKKLTALLLTKSKYICFCETVNFRV
jgi:hypothetical protein